MTQIFQNILSNGIKFTGEGGTVTAYFNEELVEDHQVKLTFICKDTGKGMSKEFTQKVCAPFNQDDKSYSRTHGGLGLGLYLTRYFVDAMNGTFELESELGKGSTFTITLLLNIPKSEQILESKVDYSFVRAIVAGVHEQDNHRIKDLLKRLKIKCDIVTDSETLVKKVKSRIGGQYEYKLCIIDESLLVDSTEILEKLNALDEGHIPVIYAMASDTNTINVLSQNDRLSQVLYKPIFQSVLFDAVMNTFGQYQVEESKQPLDDFSMLHAMIVEDNPVNADILSRVLGKTNMKVSVFENGKLAVEEFQKQPEDCYQIIFMDIQMPVMDGYEAAEKIRLSGNIHGKTIPIIAVSANAFPEDIAQSKEKGMNEHLSKPVNASKLYEIIRKYCVRESNE